MKSPFAQTVETESPGTGLAVPLGDPSEIFKPGGSQPFVQAVQEHVARLKPQLDISTETGREFIRSTAYKITRTKTYAFAKAKELSGALKARAKEIDTEANDMSNELTKLSHETRRPLTEWEDRDKERAGAFEIKLGEIYNSCLFVGAPTIEAIQARMAKLRSYEGIDWQEYRERAEQGFAECFPALTVMLAKAEKDEADRVELEELRKLKAIANRFANPLKIAVEPDGEAIPPRATIAEQVSSEPSVLTAEEEAMFDLAEIVDIDQATDILDAIKAGKIRHVQIVY